METFKSALVHSIALLSLSVTIITASIGGTLSAVAWLCAATAFGAIVVAFLIDRRLIHGKLTKIRSARKNKHKIQQYMFNLIHGASSVAIFTKDMSWANEEIESILTIKARSNSLILALPAPIPLSDRLMQDGAEVYYYGEQLGTPIRARFTLVNLDSQSLELAIGKTVGSTHTIKRHSDSNDTPLLLASELLRIVKQLPAAKRNLNEEEASIASN